MSYIRTGHQAFDELVRHGFLVVNEVGWGQVVKAPTKRDLDWFVKMVKVLGAYSVATSGKAATIEVSCGSRVDDLRFRKRLSPKNKVYTAAGSG